MARTTINPTQISITGSNASAIAEGSLSATHVFIAQAASTSAVQTITADAMQKYFSQNDLSAAGDASHRVILTAVGDGDDDVDLKFDSGILYDPTGDGTLTLTGDLAVGDDVTLSSESAVLTLGSSAGGAQSSLTHISGAFGAHGVRLNSSRQLQFGDAGTYVHQSSDAALAVVSDGTVTVDAATDIILDAGGANVTIKDDSTTTLDIVSNGATSVTLDAPGDIILDADGANVTIKDDGTTTLDIVSNGTTDVLFDAPGDIRLDAGGFDIKLEAAGTEFGRLSDDTSSNFAIFSAVQDKDMVFKGNDGGSTITALTLDMSNAGRATFNENVVVTGDLTVNGTTTTVNSTTLTVDDTIIVLGQGNDIGAGSTKDLGILLERSSSVGDKNVAFFWDESEDYFQLMQDISEMGGGDNIDVSSAAYAELRLGAQVNSGSILPIADDSHDLGSSSKQWKDLYVDGKAYIDAIEFDGTDITSTAAEINVLDGYAEEVFVQTADFIVFADADAATGNHDLRRESTSDFLTAVAGDGLSVVASQLKVDLQAYEQIFNSASLTSGKIGTTTIGAGSMLANSFEVYLNGMLQIASGSLSGAVQGGDYKLEDSTLTMTDALDSDDVLVVKYLQK